MAHEQTVRTIKHFRNRRGEEVWKVGGPSHVSWRHVLSHLVDIATATILLFLTIRFLLELFGAGRGSQFVNVVFGLTQPLVTPFSGIFPTASLGVNGGRVDPATILGMIAIAFIAYGVQQLLKAFQPKPVNLDIR